MGLKNGPFGPVRNILPPLCGDFLFKKIRNFLQNYHFPFFSFSISFSSSSVKLKRGEIRKRRRKKKIFSARFLLSFFLASLTPLSHFN